MSPLSLDQIPTPMLLSRNMRGSPKKGSKTRLGKEPLIKSSDRKTPVIFVRQDLLN